MKQIETDANCAVDTIRHAGIVRKADDQKIYVSIVAQSACASCQVKGACNITGLNEEIVEVATPPGSDYKTGDRVNVSMEKSLGARAVVLGYLLPFVLVLATLIISLEITSNQGIAGLVSLGILIPYYLVLYLNKNLMKRTFVFRIS